MGHIVTRELKNGKVAYYAQYTEHDGRRASKATKAKDGDGAQKWLARAETRVAAGLPGDPKAEARAKGEAERTRKDAEEAASKARLTLRQLCEKFKAEYQADVADLPHYRRQAWSVLKCHVLNPKIADRDVNELRRVDIVNLRDDLKNNDRSAFIISRALRQLGRVFNWAIEKELIRENPAARVKKPKTGGSITFYTSAEVARLLAWTAENDSELHPIIAFAFYTGCRRGEIAAVQWSDIDWAGGRIIIQRSWTRNARKSGKPVMLSLHPHLHSILDAYQKRTKGEGNAIVFPDPATGEMRRKYGLRATSTTDKIGSTWGLFEAIAGANAEKKDGEQAIRKFRFPWHSFRHTHATNLAENGAGLTAIRDALGQSTLHMAANYTHLAAEHTRQHVAKMPSLGPIAPTVASLDEARRKRRSGDENGTAYAVAEPYAKEAT